MSIETELLSRSNSTCELCSSGENLSPYEVASNADGSSDGSLEQCVLLCSVCRDQIENPESMDVHHWRCLSDSMWSQIPAVQVMAWRMLTRLNAEGWAQDALDMLYLDQPTLDWAQASTEGENTESDVVHRDSNGAVLAAGDTVTLIKDLNVKGANFTAKRGTAVRGISLVSDNEEHIEGRVSGQQIVILTQFVKKSN